MSGARPHRGAGPGAAAALFGWLALVYLLGTGGHVYSPDGVLRGRTTASLVEHGTPAIDGARVPPGFLVPGRGGWVAKYEGGLSLAAVPFYLLGRSLAALAPQSTARLFAGPRFLWYDPANAADDWRFFGLGLTNVAVVAALGALLYLLALRLGYAPPAALATALVAAFASPLWHYSKDLFAEPLAGLGLVVFALAVERAARRASGAAERLAAAAAGAGLGLSVAAKMPLLALLPAALVAAAWRWRRAGAARIAALLVAFGAGLALLLLVPAAWNLARFGDPWTSGYGSELRAWTTPAATGLAGLLVSPGRGLLPHFPFLLVAMAATPFAWRHSPEWTVFAWAGLGTLLALYCRWHGWDGGWAWGPRFLVPLLPFLTLLGAPLFAPRGEVRRPLRLLGGIVVALSAWVALSGTIVAHTDFHQALRESYGGGRYLEVARWSWHHYTPVDYWRFDSGSFYFFARALGDPAGWWLAALFGAGVVAALGWGARLLPRAAGAPARAGWAPLWILAAVTGAILCATWALRSPGT
jgi:hypothetical protein